MYNLTFESSYEVPYATSPFLYLLLMSMSSQKHTPDTKTHINNEYDYIVVGSGSAGSIVASRLAEKNCVTVLLLEAGKSPPKLTDLPVNSVSFVNTDIDWAFKTVPQKHNGKVLPNMEAILHAGKTLGGSSQINGMQAVRGNKKDYDNWAEQGATGWSYRDVFPYFVKLENATNTKYANSGYHGVKGPVSVSDTPYDSELKSAVYEYAKNKGYSIVDSNGGTQNGFFAKQATMRQGQRCGTAKAYLVPNEHKNNLDIVANAYVTKVIINNGQAEGVVVDFQGQTREVKARKEVIVSAGSIKSPHILMMSGVGPKKELKKHKIPVVADLPVGQNLQEHWGLMSLYGLDDHVRSFDSKQFDPVNIKKYAEEKTGPLATQTGTTNMAFLHKDGREGPEDYPDYQLLWGEGVHPMIRHDSSLKSRFYEVLYDLFRDIPFYYCLPQVLHPKARGVVSLNSSNPYDRPVVDPKYFHPEDVEVVVQGLKKCHEIGLSTELKKIGSSPLFPAYPGCVDSEKGDDKYFRCIANSIMITCNHQTGTVKMGREDDPMAVLDPQLRVKGIKNLRVVDASVMPTITGGNTQVPTMMIAEKASDMIKENIHCPA